MSLTMPEFVMHVMSCAHHHDQVDPIAILTGHLKEHDMRESRSDLAHGVPLSNLSLISSGMDCGSTVVMTHFFW
jgi:hypothetical protein